MPSILSDDDKQTVKRTVPKPANKIHAVAVAKLYIAYPDRNHWTYTGLQGAVVLANDLVGNTFWIKLVDVSPSNRGVIWDQEIYDTFQYNQDRTFFHTFELEECMAGLSFADEKEAKQFKKKVDEREKNAHKNTRSKPFGTAAAPGVGGGGAQVAAPAASTGHKSHRFGISSLLPGHRHSSASQQPPAQSIIPPREVTISTPSPGRSRASSVGIDLADPAVQSVLNDLLVMGITEDQIEEHAGFIKTYLEQNKASVAAENERKSRAPPPPPPSATPARLSQTLSPQSTGGSSSTSRRGPPPAPPPSRRAGAPAARPPSPSPSPPRAPSPPQPRFRAPPPIADAGKFAGANAPPPPVRGRATSQSAGAAPPPPPRVPAKTPLDNNDDSSSSARFGVPPPFTGNRVPPSVPPAPPTRGPVPPPPPPRDMASPMSVPPPPPLPPKSPSGGPPPPPPLPPSTSRPVPPPPGGGGPPPPPPPPPLPPSAAGSGPPPPPPLPPARAPGAPGDAPAPPPPGAAVPGSLLADIRGGARLKKVSDQEKRDRSAAMVPGGTESSASAPAASAGGAGADAGGGLAGALASALAARKSKVSHSDDEDDKDDW